MVVHFPVVVHLVVMVSRMLVVLVRLVLQLVVTVTRWLVLVAPAVEVVLPEWMLEVVVVIPQQ